MTTSPPVILVTDTSVLVNFLRVDRMDLIRAVSPRFLVTEHAATEITEVYGEQVARFDAALAAGCFEICRVEAEAALDLFGHLTATTRLGVGESATIAHALAIGAGVAIDDRRARNEALRISSELSILSTADLVVLMIREHLLTVGQADKVKYDWAENHRFRLKISSFADLL